MMRWYWIAGLLAGGLIVYSGLLRADGSSTDLPYFAAAAICGVIFVVGRRRERLLRAQNDDGPKARGD